jgi:hypothetical protein
MHIPRLVSHPFSRVKTSFLLSMGDCVLAYSQPAPVPAPSVGRSGRASVANRRIHDPDWITGF